jgi:4-amino-4-deoxy-L-arabinose transferase-like glycosyltransferase
MTGGSEQSAAGSRSRWRLRATPLEQAAYGVVALACAWFAFTAFWGIAAIPETGHLGGGSAGNMMAAEQILRWHIVYPAWGWYDGTPPTKVQYMCHHPFGQYWVPAVFRWVLGHHDYVVRLPAALMSTAIPPLLFGIARVRWGLAGGAVAAAAYVVVPIAVGFSQFTNLETFCIFGALLFFWGHTRHMARGKRRHLVASLVGLGFACAGDWAGYLLVAPMLGWALARAFVLPARFTPRFKLEPYARWWVLSVVIALGSLVLWLGLFFKAGQLGDWVGAAQVRGGGEGEPLAKILAARKNWIDFSFTPLAIVLGKVAAPVCLLRCFICRHDEETYALSLLGGSVGQYVAFKSGADVHIFWSHYFAPYFALALAQVACSVGATLGWIARVVGRRLRREVMPEAVAWATLVAGLLPALAMTPDAVRSLWVWRRTGGRYDGGGHVTRSNVDLLTVLGEVAVPATLRGTPIDVHPSVQWDWEHLWTYQGIANEAAEPVSSTPSAASHPFWIARPGGLSTAEQQKIAAHAHVRVYGDVWLVDQREPQAPLDAYSLDEREPNPLQWLLFDPTEPHRTVGTRPDPWLTWEWRAALGQPVTLPATAPRDLEEMRIAHNAAIVRGDDATAEHLREAIDAQIDRTVNVKYDTGLKLVGVRRIEGVEPRVEAWFEVATPFTSDLEFDVRSNVERAARLSLIPADTYDRDMSWPEPLPTRLWKPRCLYRTTTVLDHRIGVERYSGRWIPRVKGEGFPRRPDNRPDTLLVVVQ